MRYTCLDVRSPDVNFLMKSDTAVLNTFLENINILRQTSSTWHRILREYAFWKAFKKPVAPAGYKNKQCRKQTSVLSGRIVTAYVPLRSATERERAAFLIPCQGLRDYFTNSQFIIKPRCIHTGAHVTYFNFQMSLLYSAMVLSEEKKPALAMFTSIIFFHFC